MIEKQEKKNMKQETFQGTEDDMEKEQEKFEEKLRYVEEEIIKIKNKKWRVEEWTKLWIWRREILREQLEEAKKNGEIMNHKLKKKIEQL